MTASGVTSDPTDVQPERLDTIGMYELTAGLPDQVEAAAAGAAAPQQQGYRKRAGHRGRGGEHADLEGVPGPARVGAEALAGEHVPGPGEKPDERDR